MPNLIETSYFLYKTQYYSVINQKSYRISLTNHWKAIRIRKPLSTALYVDSRYLYKDAPETIKILQNGMLNQEYKTTINM